MGPVAPLKQPKQTVPSLHLNGGPEKTPPQKKRLYKLRSPETPFPRTAMPAPVDGVVVGVVAAAPSSAGPGRTPEAEVLASHVSPPFHPSLISAPK